MVEDGTLQEIIDNYLKTTAEWCFNSVADMKASINLGNGSFAKTLGYYSAGDEGGATYKIKNKGSITPNEQNYIAIGDNLVAEIVLNTDKINVKQFGAKGNGTDDDSQVIQSTIDYALNNNISNVYIPKGTFIVSTPIVLYDFINLRGYKRELTIIKKTGHQNDSVYNVDCVLTATHREESTLSYPRYITIENISLDSADHNSQPAYGLYLYSSSFITIIQFASRYCGCAMYLGDIWLSTIKEVSTGYGTIGMRIRAGTTLDINDVYTAQNSEYGYYIQGISYTHFSNMACDSAPNSIPYYFYYCQVSVDGLGCEAENYTTAIKLMNATVNTTAAHLHMNINSASSTVLSLQNSKLTLNSAVIGTETQTGVVSGKFLEFIGNNSTLTLNTITVRPKKFNVANTGNNYNNIIVLTKYGIYNTTAEGLAFVGNAQPEFDDTVDIQQLGLNEIHSQLSSPANHYTNQNINGQSIAYNRDNRPIGALIPNASLNNDGTALFIKSSWDKIVELPSAIIGTSLDENKLVLSFTSLSLGTNLDSIGIILNTNWRIRKKDSTTVVTITNVDYETNTITINTNSGFSVNDIVELLPPRDVRECSFMRIQPTLMGTTAERPTRPNNGVMYYDTTLNKPIWWVTNHWKDATGTNV